MENIEPSGQYLATEQSTAADKACSPVVQYFPAGHLLFLSISSSDVAALSQ